jgi:hypothetical protein
MSSLVQHSDQATRRLAAEHVRAAGRSRRADAGAVTEMARSLLRDAHASDDAEVRCRRGGAARAERAVRREPASANGRLSSRPFAARRA